MKYRKVWMTCVLLIALPTTSHADIFRWDNDELIPGTEGITPGPGALLANLDLAFADLSQCDLSGARFDYSNLTEALISLSNLHGATFNGANVVGANLHGATSYGFTKEQLYSTASYQEKNLQGIILAGWFGLDCDLSSWDFSGQDLSGAFLLSARLSRANLTGVNLANANLHGALLTDAVLTAANTRGAGVPDLSASLSRNVILPDGRIAGLDLSAGERLVVGDDHGVPDPSPKSWLAPRAPIPVTVHDHAGMAPDSAVQLVFEQDAWDSTISFVPGIPVQLGATLELTFADDVDVASQVGRTLQLFDWTGVTPTGSFTVSSPYRWDLSDLYTTGEVTLTALPEPTTAVLIALSAVVYLQHWWPRNARHWRTFTAR